VWALLSKLLSLLGLPRFPPYSVWSSAHDEVIRAADLLAQCADPTGTYDAYLRATQDQRQHLLAKAAETGAGLTSTKIAISFLVDHSGSMKGDNQILATLAIESLERLATAAGADCEVLGFTTVDWHGKPVRPEWRAAGSPPLPGRLCALRHIIYRAFGEAAPADLALMTAPDILRENVDGEALEWAAARLREVQANRRILVMISDGAPVDDSTLTENHPGILWRHDQQVVADLTARGDINLACLAIKYDQWVIETKAKITTQQDVGSVALPFVAGLMEG
jgi:cobaltochelatase CobT